MRLVNTGSYFRRCQHKIETTPLELPEAYVPSDSYTILLCCCCSTVQHTTLDISLNRAVTAFLRESHTLSKPVTALLTIDYSVLTSKAASSNEEVISL